MSMRGTLWAGCLLAALAFSSCSAHAVASCQGSAGNSSLQTESCNLTVAAGDKVIMGVVGFSGSFCTKATAGASVSTLTCQIAVNAGDKVIMASTNASQTPTFTSTTPTATWTQQRSQQRQASGGYIAAADTTAGSSGTMTCSANEGVGLTFWSMFCYDVGPLGAIDAQNSATGGSSTATTSVTTTQANDQLIVINEQLGAATFVNTGFVTQRFDANSGGGISDKLAGGAGTETETNAGSSSSWATILLAYKTTTTPAQHLPTFSSSPSQTWATRMTQNGSGNSSLHNRTFQIALADTVASASGTMTCTADMGAPDSFWSVFCYDNGPLGAIDASNTSTGTSGTPSISVTSTHVNDWYIWLSTLSGGAYTVNTGYTNEQADAASSGGLIADQLFAAAGSHSATASISSTGWTIGLIAYLPGSPSSSIKHRSKLF